ncbi:MAG: hypothetical protein PHG87_00585 [Candidatus Omnitrophica bacterium]|nr:hypothetical protein [Candidatus Omnitrophota bacterium]
MKNKFFVILIFFLLIVAITFPMLFKITVCIPGFYSTDEIFGSLWDSWRIKTASQGFFTSGETNLIAYPFGAYSGTPDYYSYVWMGLTHFLSRFTTPVITLNFQVLLNILFSAFFTYLLIDNLTGNSLVSFFGGVIFAFCPYQFVRSWQQLGLTFNQWIPLTLLAAILLREQPQRKYSLVFLVSLLLLFSFDFSVMYLGSIVLLTFFIYVIFYQSKAIISKDRKRLIETFRYIKRFLFLGLIVFVIMLPEFFPIIKNRVLLSSVVQASSFNGYKRPFEDLFTQSARPLSYFLPASVHPLFGSFTKQFIGSSLYGMSLTEHTLYLGWIPMILALYAIRRWKKDKKIRGHSFLEITPPQDFYIGFFMFLAIVAWLFSQPPWWQIGPLKIYMPSFFMYKILPMYRAYCRFGIVLMLAVAVLAGFGLKFLLEKFKSQKAKIAVMVLCCGLVLFEFWNWPPYKIIDVSKVPEVYYWIKSQPGDFVVAEYPLDYNGPNEMYKFYQTTHEKKIINGTIPGTYPNKVANTVKKLSDPRTTGVLKWMGVKYIIVHRDDYLRTEIVDEIEELQKIPKNPGLKLVKSFSAQECPDKNIMCIQKTGPIDVYLLESAPIAPSVTDK